MFYFVFQSQIIKNQIGSKLLLPHHLIHWSILLPLQFQDSELYFLGTDTHKKKRKHSSDDYYYGGEDGKGQQVGQTHHWFLESG